MHINEQMQTNYRVSCTTTALVVCYDVTLSNVVAWYLSMEFWSALVHL